MEHEPVESAIEGLDGFVFPHVSIELGDQPGLNVRRVSHDQIERLDVYHMLQGLKQIPLLNDDAIGQPQPVDVPLCDLDGLGGDIDREHVGRFQVMRDGRRDAAATGAEIDDARGLKARLMSNGLKHIFDQRFGIGPGDQHVARDFEFQIEEMSPPGEVSDRLVFRRPLDERTHLRELFFAQGSLIFGVKLDPRRA